MSQVSEIYQLLKGRQMPLYPEMALQSAIEATLDGAGIEYLREATISTGRIEFLVDGGIGVEVKVKGSAQAIYRQCVRYCESDQITALILITARAMGFPAAINGKPCYVLSPGRAWL